LETTLGSVLTQTQPNAQRATETTTEWDRLPLVAVIVTSHAPDEVGLTRRIDVPDPPGVKVMLVGLRLAVRPVDGDTMVERVTVPWKPPRLEIVIVDCVGPAGKKSCVGFAVMLKSATPTVRIVEWDSGPLIPVMFTL
jgi:hypothetical protein